MSLFVVFGVFGLIVLAVGIWLLLAGGNSFEVLYPGIALCTLTAFYYFAVVRRRKKFHSSSATARARVVDRKRPKVRAGLADNLGSDGGCVLAGLLMLLFLIADLFLLVLERVGLRERKYRHVGQNLVPDFQVKKPGIGSTMMLVELKVDDETYEAHPPGSTVGIRYSVDNPNVVELHEEIKS
jgi:hypothetical protein